MQTRFGFFGGKNGKTPSPANGDGVDALILPQIVPTCGHSAGSGQSSDRMMIAAESSSGSSWAQF